MNNPKNKNKATKLINVNTPPAIIDIIPRTLASLFFDFEALLTTIIPRANPTIGTKKAAISAIIASNIKSLSVIFDGEYLLIYIN